MGVLCCGFYFVVLVLVLYLVGILPCMLWCFNIGMVALVFIIPCGILCTW